MKIGIKFKIKDKYVIRLLERKKINLYNINGNIYIIDKKNIELIPKVYIDKTYNMGIDYIIESIKTNKDFILSILISLIILMTMNNMIFKIEVKHSSKHIRNIIKLELERYNYNGIFFKKSYNELNKLKNNILKDYKEDIEWLEILDKGMKYEIRVEERIITKEKEEPKYCDLISMKDAIIDNMNISKGDRLLNEGDYVKKGDTIISGNILFNEENKGYVCSMGEVYGVTWYRVNVSMPYNYIDKKYTNKTKYNIGIEYGTKYKELFRNRYKLYDIDKRRIFKIGKLSIYKEKVREYIGIKKRYKEKDAINIAKNKLKSKVNKGTIISQKVLQSNTYNSIMEADIFFAVKEVISKRVPKEIPREGALQYDLTK